MILSFVKKFLPTSINITYTVQCTNIVSRVTYCKDVIIILENIFWNVFYVINLKKALHVINHIFI